MKLGDITSPIIKSRGEIMNVVYNITKDCSWNCKFCCVDAKYIGNGKHSGNLRNSDELSFQEKKEVIDKLHMHYSDLTIDFSGGEIFTNDENFEIVKYASNLLGRNNIGISTSGMHISEKIYAELDKVISEIEFTIDFVPFQPFVDRPLGYHEYAANAISRLQDKDIRIGVQTVLTKIM